MKPARFAYAAPATVDELLGLLADAGDDAAVIGGGQSLVPLLNLRLARPELVVDPRRITSLAGIVEDDGGITVGATTRAADLEAHAAATRIPGLADALRHVGHRQIRARTTVGGSIAHADPAAELPALLQALDGSVQLRSRDRGERTVAAADFFVGPLTTARAPDELVTAVRFPAYRGRLAVREVAKRPGDFAIVGAIAGFLPDAGTVTDPRIVVFGVSGTSPRHGRAEDAVAGRPAGAAAFAAAADAVRAGLDPYDDLHGSADYRRHLAGELVVRALESVA